MHSKVNRNARLSWSNASHVICIIKKSRKKSTVKCREKSVASCFWSSSCRFDWVEALVFLSLIFRCIYREVGVWTKQQNHQSCQPHAMLTLWLNWGSIERSPFLPTIIIWWIILDQKQAWPQDNLVFANTDKNFANLSFALRKTSANQSC